MAAFYTQIERPLLVSVTGFGPDDFLAVGFRGREAVNELFAFDLQLLAPTTNPPVAFEKLLGQPTTLDIVVPGRDPRTLVGVLTDVRQIDRDRDFTHFVVTLRPAWWYATLRTNSRVFQQKTAVDILKAVLGPFGPITTRLATAYPSRDYTCQYQETDWAFACRIMEEEGIFFTFAVADGKLNLVLADQAAGAPDAGLNGPVRFDSDAGRRAGSDFRAWKWVKTQRVVPTDVTVWDAHLELFDQNLAADAKPPTAVTAGEVSHPLAPAGVGAVPVYLHDGDYAKRYDGVAPGGGSQSGDLQNIYTDARRTARLRAEAGAAAAVRIAAAGNCPLLAPGTTFELSGHFDADGTYLVTAVEHAADFEATLRGGAGKSDGYANTFEAAPPDLTPRPARITPRPRVGGPLTALVVGPSGQEIFVDKYGRIKVQFFWDRVGTKDAGSSCWVRCSQLWAGKGWGAFFWPRIGMEVVVHFEDGDPDRPLVTGCVYNATNMPPPDLPADAMIGGIKSCIFFGDPASQFNGIYFFDAPDYEYIQIHSETHTVHNSEAHKIEYSPGAVIEFRGQLG